MDKQAKIQKLMLLQERLKRLAETNLHLFLKHYAWPVLQPGNKFVDNWHLHAICEHLEAVAKGQIKRLLISMPFRMLKSTVVTQTFPAWEWIRSPHMQYLTASYSKDVATRDAVDSRRIIESVLYQEAWGGLFKMTSDQNVKTRYENDHKGMRVVTSTDSAGTGFGGNRIIVDDPVSALEADSPAARALSIEWWKGTASTRMNNPQDDAMIVVHQRLHLDDLTGYILAEETGWEHLVLPMRYDPELRKTTSLGFQDPRKEKGALLAPARLSEETVKEMETRLGSYHTASQLQQDPTKRGGMIIHGGWFQRYKFLPQLEYRKIYADTAQKTAERNDFSVFECWGRGINGNIYLLDMIRGKWEAPELKRRAIDFWNKHKGLVDLHTTGLLRQMQVEDKSSGTGLIQEIREGAGGIPIFAVQRNRDKYMRVMDVVNYIEAGLVYLPEDSPFASAFIAEAEAFTANDSHDHDDMLDPMMDAIMDMLGKPDTLSKWAKLGK